MHPDELTLPLWRLLGRAAVRAVTFARATERWSHRTAAERAARRARWPAWRRALRPVGLAIFWLGAATSVAVGDHPGVPATLLRFGWILLLFPIAVVGVADWWRDVPSQRAAGHSRAASHGSPQGIAPEDPFP